MANISPTAGFDSVPILATTDRIKGGVSTDSVATQQAENANKQAWKLLNNIEALRTGKVSGPPNSILSANVDVDGFTPDFASFASDILTVSGTASPLLLCFADGLNEFGTSQIVVELTGDLTLDFTALTGQYLVFAVWNGTALSLEKLALGNTNPRYHGTLAKPAFDTTDQFWFDPTSNTMYRDVAGAGTWVKVNAILLGGAEVGASDFWYGKPIGIPAFSFQDPVGMIKIWHDSGSIPYGHILCNGATVKVSQYPDLYNAMGTVYASTTPLDEFDLPDFSGETLGSGPTNVVYIMRAY